jgi:lipoic acid synthetase
MEVTKKPDWLRVKFPSGETWKKVDEVLARRRLHTVCDEARCPNKGECWGNGTATFMILGDVCTRGCAFCAVATAKEGRPVREDEGEAIACAAAELGLDYVVLTSVDRDDLPDRGAAHFAACVRALKQNRGLTQIGAELKIEALIPDYCGAELELVAAAAPDVIAHNVETVRRLQHIRDGRASFDKSLRTLREAKEFAEKTDAPIKTKSSLLLGLGETADEVYAAMDELRSAGTDILVMGQYLQPTKKQVPVAEYVTPEQFAAYAAEAKKRGFASVVSAPLARTSYHAKEASPYWQKSKR